LKESGEQEEGHGVEPESEDGSHGVQQSKSKAATPEPDAPGGERVKEEKQGSPEEQFFEGHCCSRMRGVESQEQVALQGYEQEGCEEKRVCQRVDYQVLSCES